MLLSSVFLPAYVHVWKTGRDQPFVKRTQMFKGYFETIANFNFDSVLLLLAYRKIDQLQENFHLSMVIGYPKNVTFFKIHIE